MPATVGEGMTRNEAIEDERPVRFVVDVTYGPQAVPDVDAMFTAVKARFLGDAALSPMVLILTERQAERLPRSFEELRGWLILEKVPTLEAALARSKQLGSAGALVVSCHPHLPIERWAALRLGGSIAEIDPPDALVAFHQKGALPGLPAVKRPLSRIAKEEETPLPETDAIEMRRLMMALCRGDNLRGSGRSPGGEDREHLVRPGQRLSWARKLGVEAAATEREWAEALPQYASLVDIIPEPQLLSHALWLAHYEPVESVAFQANGVLHVMNPPEHLRKELVGLAGVEVHAIEANRRPVLEAMVQEASMMSEDDLLRDPFLQRLVERHMRDDVDREALLLARAALVLSGVIRPRPSPSVKDLRAAMATLLDGTEMEALLRLDVSAELVQVGDRLWTPFVAPAVYVSWALERGPLASLPPVAPVTLRRGEKVAAVRHDRARDKDVEASIKEVSIRAPLLHGDPAHWVDVLFEASRLHRDYPYLRAPVVRAPSWDQEMLAVSRGRWAAADREIAFVVAALRSAIPSASLLLQPNGAGLLPLGNGIFAEIFVRGDCGSADQAPEASLIQPIKLGVRRGSTEDQRRKWSMSSLLRLVAIYVAQTDGYGSATTEIGARLPHAVFLRGRGLSANITFHASPLFAAMPQATVLSAAASSGGKVLDQARRDEERRREEASGQSEGR